MAINLPDSTIDRRAVLPELFPDPENYLLLSGLAGAAKDTAAWTREAENLLTLCGAMGGAVSMGLGMALAAPGQQVAVITGDGELLMNIGALATVASAAPDNLTIVCIDNGQHGETGGQPGHTSRRTDLAKMAEGAGFASVMTVSAPGDLAAASRFLAESVAPRFLWARVMPGPPSAYKRNWDLAECRLRFRNSFSDRRTDGHR
jgi:thiamine pyrophosphate-dependent acetolactate synthase large subunit-like protein